MGGSHGPGDPYRACKVVAVWGQGGQPGTKGPLSCLQGGGSVGAGGAAMDQGTLIMSARWWQCGGRGGSQGPGDPHRACKMVVVVVVVCVCVCGV